jgi:hypothetical protein
LVEVIALHGGGHIATFRFLPESGKPSVNVLWEAPWKSADPGSLAARRLSRRYGPKGIGEFLASFTGHALCLDYFGVASPEETLRGLPLHGEAACSRWKPARTTRRVSAARAEWQVHLPAAALSFTREIFLPEKQSIAIFRETVANERSVDHYFQWMQHVTLGPPFLEAQFSRVFLSGTRSKTWPLGYEGKSLLASDGEFSWPLAPREDEGTADLSIPFAERGKGFVASVLMEPSRELQFIAGLNWQLGLVSGYCFRREDFPWVAVWEENCARSYAPWNGSTQARGLEFGTTPMPIGKEKTFLAGKLFDAAGWARIPALGRRTVSYVAFLAVVPQSWRAIASVTLRKDFIVLHGMGHSEVVRVPARGIRSLRW